MSRKPDPCPSENLCYAGVVVAVVEWTVVGPEIHPVGLGPKSVPDHCRDQMELWLVRKAMDRGFELTPADARRRIFGD